MVTSRQDFFTKKPSKTAFSGGTIRTPQRNQASNSWWRIVLLVLILAAG